MNAKNTCYACDTAPVSKEHVPPRCLFPEASDLNDGRDYRKNLITVPSCDTHNNAKSGDDLYLLWILCLSLPANSVAHAQAFTKLVRAMELDSKIVRSLADRAEDFIVYSADGKPHLTKKTTVDGARLAASLEMISRGLFWHEFRKPYRGSVRVHPDFLKGLDVPGANALDIHTSEAVLRDGAEILFAGLDWSGSNQDVFKYKVMRDGQVVDCVMRMTFYGGCNVTAFFDSKRP